MLLKSFPTEYKYPPIVHNQCHGGWWSGNVGHREPCYWLSLSRAPNAWCLKSSDPRLGMRQLFGDVTKGHRQIAAICVATRARVIERHFRIWMRVVRNTGTVWYLSHCFSRTKIRCLSVNETKNPQHLHCGRLISATHVDKRIPDPAEPRMK